MSDDYVFKIDGNTYFFTAISKAFMQFIKEVGQRLGNLDSQGRGIPKSGLMTMEMPDDATEIDVVKKAWDSRAEDWIITEGVYVYQLVMETLLSYFMKAPPLKPEIILSLGSGPGLYETFLAKYLTELFQKQLLQFVCVDFATKMTQKQKEIMKNVYVEIKGSRRRLSNVQAITDDMTNLKRIKTGSVDRIICNNSLQWANDWKATIQEMARVIRPETGGYLYLVIHPHEMALYNHDRTPLIKLGEFGPEDLFNALEDNGFKILTSQPITGQKGMGQMGRGISRIFFYAKHSGKNCR